MNTHHKIICVSILLASSTLLLSGCNTVEGAFRGAGKDVKSVVEVVQPSQPSHKHHKVVKKEASSTKAPVKAKSTTQSAKPSTNASAPAAKSTSSSSTSSTSSTAPASTDNSSGSTAQ